MSKIRIFKTELDLQDPCVQTSCTPYPVQRNIHWCEMWPRPNVTLPTGGGAKHNSTPRVQTSCTPYAPSPDNMDGIKNKIYWINSDFMMYINVETNSKTGVWIITTGFGSGYSEQRLRKRISRNRTRPKRLKRGLRVHCQNVYEKRIFYCARSCG